MPSFFRAPASPHALNELRAAMLWAREKGLSVRPSSHFGVISTSEHSDVMATWEVDPLAKGGPNPIGCAILRCQPQTSDTDEAAVMALGAPLAFVEGFCAAVAREELSKAWSESVARVQYLAGAAAGSMVRAWLLRAPATVVVPGEDVRS